jgi:hypothetical protein
MNAHGVAVLALLAARVEVADELVPPSKKQICPSGQL